MAINRRLPRCALFALLAFQALFSASGNHHLLLSLPISSSLCSVPSLSSVPCIFPASRFNLSRLTSKANGKDRMPHMQADVCRALRRTGTGTIRGGPLQLVPASSPRLSGAAPELQEPASDHDASARRTAHSQGLHAPLEALLW